MGVMFLAILGLALPLTLAHTSGLRTVLSMIVNGIAAVVFLIHGGLAWEAVGLLAAGSLVGGYAGARLALALPAPALPRGGHPRRRGHGREAAALMVSRPPVDRCRPRRAPAPGASSAARRPPHSKQRVPAGRGSRVAHCPSSPWSTEATTASTGIAAERGVVRQQYDRIAVRWHLHGAGHHPLRVERSACRCSLRSVTAPTSARKRIPTRFDAASTMKTAAARRISASSSNSPACGPGTTRNPTGDDVSTSVAQPAATWSPSGGVHAPACSTSRTASGPGPSPVNSSLAQLPNHSGPRKPPATDT